jgi:predicted Zn-dependent protease
MTTSRLDAFRSMVERDPGNHTYRYGYANELLKAGRWAEAREQFDAYLGLHDDEGSAYRMLAEAAERLGLREDARDAYRRGIEAATRHGHASMVDEFTMKLEDLDD